MGLLGGLWLKQAIAVCPRESASFFPALTCPRGPHRTQQVQEMGLRCRSRCWSCSFSAVSTFTRSSSLLSSAVHF